VTMQALRKRPIEPVRVGSKLSIAVAVLAIAVTNPAAAQEPRSDFDGSDIFASVPMATDAEASKPKTLSKPVAPNQGSARELTDEEVFGKRAPPTEGAAVDKDGPWKDYAPAPKGQLVSKNDSQVFVHIGWAYLLTALAVGMAAFVAIWIAAICQSGIVLGGSIGLVPAFFGAWIAGLGWPAILLAGILWRDGAKRLVLRDWIAEQFKLRRFSMK
jgi:hypothetical protein